MRKKPKERFGSGQPADHMRRACSVIRNLNRYATTDERLRYREWDHASSFRAHEPGLQAGAVFWFLSGSGSGEAEDGILRIERPRQLPRPPTIGWPGQHRHPFASGPSVTPREIATDLRRRLEAVAEPATKAWFENYLKHAVSYRGVKTPQVSRILADWRRVHDLGQWPDKDQLALARSLIEGRYAEDKFAGTLYIQKYLLRRMDPVQILDAAENLFVSGAFFDWSTTDWFSVRVLGPMIARHDMPVAHRVAGWRGAENLWQRRSSIVPFRTVVRDEAYHPVIEATVEALVPERDRFIQTGIGWVISDLSKVHPKVAETLVERHFADFSPEVIRRHTRHLPGHAEYKRRASVNRRRGNP